MRIHKILTTRLRMIVFKKQLKKPSQNMTSEHSKAGMKLILQKKTTDNPSWILEGFLEDL